MLETNNSKIISVGQLNFYLKSIIDSNTVLSNLLVKGEISNLKYHPSGHVYFSLKDNDGVVRCVMFSSFANRLEMRLNEGDKVIVSGSLSLYPLAGNYQIYVKNVTKDGLGSLYIEFEKLKKELQEKGLFDQSHKNKLIEYPLTIGVLSGKTGAGLRDILSIIKRRWPIAEVIVFPCQVQGKDAPKTIIKALEDASKFNLDCTIIARGGGSQEDLWCFNDKDLAYAIYNYKNPIISGVGHEIDFTICDFVSDLRAATPSEASEKATPNIDEVLMNIRNMKDILINNSKKLVMDKQNILMDYESYLTKEYFDKLISLKKEALRDKKEELKSNYLNFERLNLNKIIEYKNTLINNYKYYLTNKRNTLINQINLLDNISPLKVLSRGYSIVSNSEGIINSINKVKINDIVRITMSDGKVYACITRKDDKNGK